MPVYNRYAGARKNSLSYASLKSVLKVAQRNHTANLHQRLTIKNILVVLQHPLGQIGKQYDFFF